MKLHVIILAVVVCVIIGLTGCGESTQTPVTVDAPKLASALKWLGICGVLCSALGATGLIVASRNRSKRRK